MGNKVHLSTATIVFALAISGCTDGTPSKANNDAPAAKSVSAEKFARGDQQVTKTPRKTPSLDGGIATKIKASTNTKPDKENTMFLPVESKFISQDGMRVDTAGEALRSQKFDSIARSFENDSAKDKNALDLTNLYKQSIRQQAGPTDQLVSFSCGLSLCIGAIRTRTPGNYDMWVQKFFADTSTPSYGFADSVVKLSENYYEGRFLFSTDPAANAMAFKSRPLPRNSN